MSRKAGPAEGAHAETLLTGALAAVAARAAYAVLVRHPPGGKRPWARANHRGEQVTLLEGPAAAAAAVAAVIASPGSPSSRMAAQGRASAGLSARQRAALAVAGAGAAVLGGYDDLAGTGDRRGFRGHLGALARGEVTTGAAKLGGIGATGLAAAILLGGPVPDVVINAGLAAGGANLLNLFDLRPGRAIKVALLAGSLLAAGPPAAGRAAAAPVGSAMALLPEDLGERAMLGDAGANALGAMLGTAAAATLPRPVRIAALAAIVGLTAASEKVSFTKVIEGTPALRRLDMLGRRPPATAAPSAQPGTATGEKKPLAASGAASPRGPVGTSGPASYVAPIVPAAR